MGFKNGFSGGVAWSSTNGLLVSRMIAQSYGVNTSKAEGSFLMGIGVNAVSSPTTVAS